MKKSIILFLISLLTIASSSTIDFKLRTMYLKADAATKFKLNIFNAALLEKLNSYNWEFPHDDFEGIESNINVNIERSVGDNEFSGMITLSCGLTTKNKVTIPLNKDIYYNEKDVLFNMDIESDPDIDSKEPSTVETILRFYIINALGEIFDRLSYTDQKNFKLIGSHYYVQLYEFENLLNSAQERKKWSKRLDIINTIKQEKNINERKLNAMLYNASYFVNSGKSKRAKYFVRPIYEALKVDEEMDNDVFFKNNYFALSEIFELEADTTYINFLIKKDPAHKSFYENKFKRSKKSKSKSRNKNPKSSELEPEKLLE